MGQTLAGSRRRRWEAVVREALVTLLILAALWGANALWITISGDSIDNELLVGAFFVIVLLRALAKSSSESDS